MRPARIMDDSGHAFSAPATRAGANAIIVDPEPRFDISP
jgi:hypothetical protein